MVNNIKKFTESDNDIIREAARKFGVYFPRELIRVLLLTSLSTKSVLNPFINEIQMLVELFILLLKFISKFNSDATEISLDENLDITTNINEMKNIHSQLIALANGLIDKIDDCINQYKRGVYSKNDLVGRFFAELLGNKFFIEKDLELISYLETLKQIKLDVENMLKSIGNNTQLADQLSKNFQHFKILDYGSLGILCGICKNILKDPLIFDDQINETKKFCKDCLTEYYKSQQQLYGSNNDEDFFNLPNSNYQTFNLKTLQPACSLFKNLIKNSEERYDEWERNLLSKIESESPYFNFIDLFSGTQHQMWFDSPDSLTIKVNIARTMNLRGVGVWNIARPTQKLLKTPHTSYSPNCTTQVSKIVRAVWAACNILEGL
ncbi:hypothetical protein ACTFIZ_010326 [Dictyostelium cf. discoideum]